MSVHNSFRPINAESPSGLSTRERDESYRAVVHVEGNWRIIICKDRIQWIIQRAKKAGNERRWQGVSYATNRTSLICLWASLGCPLAPELDALPAVFSRGHPNE